MYRLRLAGFAMSVSTITKPSTQSANVGSTLKALKVTPPGPQKSEYCLYKLEMNNRVRQACS